MLIDVDEPSIALRASAIARLDEFAGKNTSRGSLLQKQSQNTTHQGHVNDKQRTLKFVTSHSAIVQSFSAESK